MLRWQTQQNSAGKFFEALYRGQILVGIVAPGEGEFVMECDLPPSRSPQTFETEERAKSFLERIVREWIRNAHLLLPEIGEPSKSGPSRKPRDIRAAILADETIEFEFRVSARTNGRLWVSTPERSPETITKLYERLKTLGYDPRMNGKPGTEGRDIIEI